MRGKKKTPPEEAIIIKLAKEFGITPMELEEKMTSRWWDWILAYESEHASAINGRRKN